MTKLTKSFSLKEINYDINKKTLLFQFDKNASRVGGGITTLEEVMKEIERVIINLQQ